MNHDDMIDRWVKSKPQVDVYMKSIQHKAMSGALRESTVESTPKEEVSLSLLNLTNFRKRSTSAKVTCRLPQSDSQH